MSVHLNNLIEVLRRAFEHTRRAAFSQTACVRRDGIRRTIRQQICAAAVLQNCRVLSIQTACEHCNAHISSQDNDHRETPPLPAFLAIAASAFLVVDSLASSSFLPLSIRKRLVIWLFTFDAHRSICSCGHCVRPLREMIHPCQRQARAIARWCLAAALGGQTSIEVYQSGLLLRLETRREGVTNTLFM